MRKLIKRLSKSQAGFTLVEILLAAGILGLIAAVAIPAVGSVRSSSEVKAKASEQANVQAAVDSMMADQGIESLDNPVAVATNDMTAFPDSAYPLNGAAFGDFIRQTATSYCYTSVADGGVTQAACP